MKEGNEMKRTHFWSLLLCFAVIAGLLAGCGGSSASEEAYDYAVAETEAATSEKGVTSSSGLSEISDPSAKLIRTVYLDAQTQEYDTLMTALDEKIAELGGYVESRDAYNGSEYHGYSNRYCNLIIRIPAEKLDQFVTHVNENFNVTNTSETVENVTLQYADTASRVEALETEQTRLLELLEAAQSLEDILKIEERLSDVRYELTSYASRLRVMDNQVTYATVHLNIDEVEKLTPVEEPTVWERISEGFSETIADIADGAVDFFVWFAINSPRIAIWAVVIAIIVVITRKVSCHRKAKKALKNNPPKEESAE